MQEGPPQMAVDRWARLRDWGGAHDEQVVARAGQRHIQALRVGGKRAGARHGERQHDRRLLHALLAAGSHVYRRSMLRRASACMLSPPLHGRPVHVTFCLIAHTRVLC